MYFLDETAEEIGVVQKSFRGIAGIAVWSASTHPPIRILNTITSITRLDRETNQPDNPLPHQ